MCKYINLRTGDYSIRIMVEIGIVEIGLGIDKSLHILSFAETGHAEMPQDVVERTVFEHYDDECLYLVKDCHGRSLRNSSVLLWSAGRGQPPAQYRKSRCARPEYG